MSLPGGRLTPSRWSRFAPSGSWSRFAPSGGGQYHATGEAWTVVSTLLSGICIFGGAGFGLDHLFGTRPVLVAIGLVVGAALGVYLVYAKYFNAPDAPKPPKAAPVAGWSRASSVAGAAPEAHPPTPELANWPNVKHATLPEGSDAS